MRKAQIITLLLGLIVCILAMNAVALHYHLYWRILWLDIPMHFFGGFWLGLGALWLYFLSGRFKHIPDSHRSAGYVCILSVFSAIVFGSLWEAYELSLDVFIRLADVYDVSDTVSDLCFDVLGAVFAAGFFIKGDYHIEK